MVLVDTSVFIDLLRGVKMPDVEVLIVSGEVILSATVYLELLVGVRRAEEKILKKFLTDIGPTAKWPTLATCESLLKRSRRLGLHGGLPDLFILADALENRARLMTFDKRLEKLAERVDVALYKGNC